MTAGRSRPHSKVAERWSNEWEGLGKRWQSTTPINLNPGVFVLAMVTRSKHLKTRKKRQHRASQSVYGFDPHAEAFMDSLADVEQLIVSFASAEDPESTIEAEFNRTITEIVEGLHRFDALRLIEVARMRFLPISFDGDAAVTPEPSAANVELLALIALAAKQETDAEDADLAPVEFQEMSRFIAEAKERLKTLINLAQLKSVLAIDPKNKLAMVSLLIQSTEVLIRNPSYPTMSAAINHELLDLDPIIHAALEDELGFDAATAQCVLDACHELQVVSLNHRFDEMRRTSLNAMESSQDADLDRELTELAGAGAAMLFEPDVNQATVGIEDLAAYTGLTAETVKSVIERFRLYIGTSSVVEVVEAFTTGKNPMRARPLIVSNMQRVMLPHPALNAVAVRGNLEEYLKTSSSWSRYAKRRGELLESRTHAALERLFPDAHFRDGFEYYVPNDEAELAVNDPAGYTKRVEGDHLVVQGDVAIIVEDKAVALSALSRGGKGKRIRTDLTGIITNAAEQAGRLRDRIQYDGGLRVDGEGWVDLGHIREIHTIAVSLDDISAVLSATAELVNAGLLAPDNIPWTVSLHDLEIIAKLIDRPAEFLLYLRRRLNSDATVKFRAADELDLFLHFFSTGLWVEPDPSLVRDVFPYFPAPTKKERRRFRSQKSFVLTSHTDRLDDWYYGKNRLGGESAPKPAMTPSPIGPLLDELQARRVTNWLSISATLLGASAEIQQQFAYYPVDLLNNPSLNGVGRRFAVPLVPSADPTEAWLVVWATRPSGTDPISAEKSIRNYVQVKKHQLSLPRGVVFLYDEATRELVDAYYDGHAGPLSPDLEALLQSLRPATDFQAMAVSTRRSKGRPLRGTAGTSGKNTARKAAKKKRKR